MLSLDFIRKNKEVVQEAARLKNREVDVDKILMLDDQRREVIQKIEKLRQERNLLAKENTETNRERGKQIKIELKELEDKERSLTDGLNVLLLSVPNVPYIEVPHGKDETGNVELRRVGEVPEFSFTPKSHIDLIKMHDLADLERGAKVSGYRGYFLKNELALLHMAVLQHAFFKIAQKGYVPLIAPSLVKEFTLFGNGQFPWGREEVYHLEKDDMYLAGTAEVPVTAYFSDEILNEKDLPKKFVAFSPCFRREIGSYGKDTKGIYRVHEFWKVEQVVIGKADKDESITIHEELQKNAEEVLQDLKVPYRVLLMCTGDMGEPQVKKYDIETWMPSREGYGETMSNSIMTDFQTRRLNIKYRTSEGKTKHCYSYNNTAIASPRVLIAILENYQQEDGTILIPHVLQKYIGKEKIGE